MQRCFVAYYNFVAVKDGFKPTFRHRLARRMTALQKAVLEAGESFASACPQLFQRVLVELSAPIYYSTGYGELTSVLDIMDTIRTGQFPVSPAAFQHSVNNAAAAYLGMVYGLRNPSLTFTSGFLSTDKALFWGFQQVSRGLLPGLVLVAGLEGLASDPSHHAEAEILVLLSEDEAEGCGHGPWRFELHQVELLTATTSGGTLREQEGPSHALPETVLIKEKAGVVQDAAQLRLDVMEAPFTRVVRSLEGEGVCSRWKKSYQ